MVVDSGLTSKYGTYTLYPQNHVAVVEKLRRQRLFVQSALLFVAVVGVLAVIVSSIQQASFLEQTTITVSSLPVPTPSSLPLGWEVRYTTKGVPFYYDAINDVTSWSPPPTVGYPTVLQAPLFTQTGLPVIPPTALVTNTPLRKWGQFGIGPSPYSPVPYQVASAPTSVVVHNNGDRSGGNTISISVPPSLPGYSPQVLMNGGVAPIGSSLNTSAAFWAYKNHIVGGVGGGQPPLGSSPSTAAAFADYARHKNKAFIYQSGQPQLPSVITVPLPAPAAAMVAPAPAVDLTTGIGPSGESPLRMIASIASVSNLMPSAKGSQGTIAAAASNGKNEYTVYVPRFCQPGSTSPMCGCNLAGMATSSGTGAGGCGATQPIVVRDDVKEGEWKSSTKMVKHDGSEWSASYKLSKDAGEWDWEANSKGAFRIGGKRKAKAKAKAGGGPLTKCPEGSYLGASGNCKSKTKCADGTYCTVGRIGSPPPPPSTR